MICQIIIKDRKIEDSVKLLVANGTTILYKKLKTKKKYYLSLT